jgi:RND family efflux transporter MFP subunit
MRKINLIFTAVVIILASAACGGGKTTELAKLKKQQAALTEKITNLEKSDDPPGKAGTMLDSAKFRFVAVTYAMPGVFDHYIRVQGKLDGDQNAAVFADVPGTVTARYADVGQSVVKGQVLAQIDDQQFRKQLESLETQHKLASDLYEKQKRLWEQKIGSEVQYLQSKAAGESLEQQISALKEQIGKFRIKSPIDGTIEECNIKVGSVVSPDPHSAAFRVVAFGNLKVSAEVSEAYAARVRQGDRAVILFPDLNRQVEAKIDFVSRYINPVNRTFIIESRIGDKFQGMKANMLAIIQINDYHSATAFRMPMNVIQADESGSYVYVIRKKERYSEAVKQPVVLGNTYNGIAEILKGLAINDKVVTSGFQELIDGEYVRFGRPLEYSGSGN